MARRRQRIMGLPIGKRRQTFPVGKVIGLGGAAAAAAAAAPAARRAFGRGREVAAQTEDIIGSAKHVADSVSSHSSSIGKVASAVGSIGKLTSGGGKDGKDQKPRLAHLIEEHTDIAAPRAVVYNQWTQMEMFPAIAKAAVSVEQQEDDKVQWTAKIGPSRREWTARITEQVPDERIVWKAEGGLDMEGVVTFHSLDEELTRVMVEIHYKPQGAVETVGNKLRIQRRRVRRDLRLFKHDVELRGEETGAWRGQVPDDGESSDGDGASRARRTARTAAAARPTRRSSGNTAPRSSGTSSRRTSSGSGQRPSGTSRRRSPTGSTSSGTGRRPSATSSRRTSSGNGRRASGGSSQRNTSGENGTARSRARTGSR